VSVAGPAAAPAELASAELRVRLGALLRGVQAALARRDARIAALARPELAHLAITQQHAATLLAEVEGYATAGRAYGPGTALTPAEQARLAELGDRARVAGFRLPGETLTGLGLGPLDLEVLLLVAAPVLEPAFGALYSYLNDLRSCAAFTTTLGVEVLAVDADHERQVLTACGPFGTVRGDGWVTASVLEKGAATMLRPADGVVELLAGAPVDANLLAREPAPAPAGPHAHGAVPQGLPALAAAFQAGRVEVVGLWGPPGHGGHAGVVAALAGPRPTLRAEGVAGDVDRLLQRATLAEAVCVLTVPLDPTGAAHLADRVSRSRAPTILLGTEPLRVPELILRRRFAELTLPAPGYAERRTSWSAAFPQLDGGGIDDLAGRFRLLPEEIEAVARLDATCAAWAANGDRPPVGTLAGLVSRRRSPRVAAVRTPVRGPGLLVLPDAERAQVLEVAAAARAWPRVADAWRLDRFGNPGVVALFTGEPGTGKTLAAEVIAVEIGLDLMEVDLSRLVSKWLGETEKHLDAVFGEAEASNCVLFFDEADAIFGQRGEISRGSDRYANLEVGYLLQRLERFDGLVILASNLRANLDPAFTRRFHHVVHFPRPAEPERRRLWEIALGPPVELAEPVDLDLLAALDLTGASIAAIIRSAGLAAARGPDAGGPAPLTVADLIAATRKQYQREARLLPREQLGAYARLL
jgi:hypothetical protein